METIRTGFVQELVQHLASAVNVSEYGARFDSATVASVTLLLSQSNTVDRLGSHKVWAFFFVFGRF